MPGSRPTDLFMQRKSALLFDGCCVGRMSSTQASHLQQDTDRGILLDRVAIFQVEASLKIPKIDKYGKAFFDINDDGSQDLLS
jgi:hypothetical protein